MKKLRILGISGSIRTLSTSSHIMEFFQSLIPEHVEYQIFHGLEDLPHFNPDKKTEASIEHFRELIRKSDGVIACTPEYAFWVPGVLKNALDWLVSSGELNEKPVASVSSSPLPSGGDKALASLLLTLQALGTRRYDHSSFSIGCVREKISLSGDVSDMQTTVELRRIWDALLGEIIQN